VPTELIIVARDNPELHESLQREQADHPDVEVILDRRRGERRRKNTAPWIERRRYERRSYQEVAAIATQGWVRVRAGVAQTLPDEHPPITRTGPPIPRQVSGNLFTWTLTLNQYPSRTWRDLFVHTKDRTIDYSPDRVRFYQNNLIFESDEKMVATWMQFLARWLGLANERYAKHLAEQRQARVLQHEFARDPKERLREAAERFKNL
jgi:hypothetical protein